MLEDLEWLLWLYVGVGLGSWRYGVSVMADAFDVLASSNGAGNRRGSGSRYGGGVSCLLDCEAGICRVLGVEMLRW